MHSSSGDNNSNVSTKISLQSESPNLHRPPTAKMVNMMDIGSRSLFGPEQDAFRETVRKFMQKEVLPHSQL